MLITSDQLRQAVAHLESGDWQAAHGIVHVMEGDLANARYWYREAGRAFPEGASPAEEVAALRRALG
jgi:hypothetical protein